MREVNQPRLHEKSHSGYSDGQEQSGAYSSMMTLMC